MKPKTEKGLGLATLTKDRRIRLILDVMSGWVAFKDKEERILDILLTAPRSDAREVIRGLDGTRLLTSLRLLEIRDFEVRFQK
jgi:hypothetical protein